MVTQMHVRAPVDIPLWGDVIMLILVGFLFGFIIRDLIEVWRTNNKDKER